MPALTRSLVDLGGNFLTVRLESRDLIGIGLQCQLFTHPDFSDRWYTGPLESRAAPACRLNASMINIVWSLLIARLAARLKPHDPSRPIALSAAMYLSTLSPLRPAFARRPRTPHLNAFNLLLSSDMVTHATADPSYNFALPNITMALLEGTAEPFPSPEIRLHLLGCLLSKELFKLCTNTITPYSASNHHPTALP